MEDQGMSHGTRGKSPSRRLVLLTIIMFGFAALTFLPSLFSRGGTGFSTGSDLPNIFIPIWVTLTIATVVISMWFAKFLMEAEKGRDSETLPTTPQHSH